MNQRNSERGRNLLKVKSVLCIIFKALISINLLKDGVETSPSNI